MGNNVKLTVKDNIAVVTLTNPDNFNPLNKATGKELLETIEAIRDDGNIRCLVITGSGKAFSAGGDIKQFKASIESGTSAQVMDDLTRDLYKIALYLRLYPKPVIAAVNGWAVGAGMNLALSCDLIIASENAKFSQSFSKLALIPGFAGSIILSRQLPWQQAAQMAFFGDTYTAEEMRQLGFINEIVPPEKLDAVSMEWAQKLASGPTLTYARTKELFFDALSTPLEQHLENERQMQIKSAETEDYKIGVFALNEKKEPKFVGK
ncbi:MAG: enoyl-CoA hydratase/isomerase family protein [Candidatus Lokiarchaeota archaeon]|nr:enoyl-CoA hydratase/isomerase family protein [Candidatus Lokiarchaeota archaeon]